MKTKSKIHKIVLILYWSTLSMVHNAFGSEEPSEHSHHHGRHHAHGDEDHHRTRRDSLSQPRGEIQASASDVQESILVRPQLSFPNRRGQQLSPFVPRQHHEFAGFPCHQECSSPLPFRERPSGSASVNPSFSQPTGCKHEHHSPEMTRRRPELPQPPDCGGTQGFHKTLYRCQGGRKSSSSGELQVMALRGPRTKRHTGASVLTPVTAHCSSDDSLESCSESVGRIESHISRGCDERHILVSHRAFDPQCPGSEIGYEIMMSPTRVIVPHIDDIGNAIASEPWEATIRTAIHNIPVLLKKYFAAALPAFVEVTIKGFKERKRKECSLEEVFMLSMIQPETFHYVTRDQRPTRESVAIQGYASDATRGKDGILNKIKRDTMDDLLMWVEPVLPKHFRRKTIDQLEHVIDSIFDEVGPAIATAMFRLLSDDLVDSSKCCGGKIKSETIREIAAGTGRLVIAILDRVLLGGTGALPALVSSIIDAIKGE